MENNFDDIMAKRSDEELIAIITIDKNKYQESAVISALKEFEYRNLDKAIIEDYINNSKNSNENELDIENLNKIYIFANNIIEKQNCSVSEVQNILIKNGYNSNDISWVVNRLLFKQQEKKDAIDDMFYGTLWFAGGFLLTIADIGYIFYGAILVGGFQFLKGAFNYLSINSKNQ